MSPKVASGSAAELEVQKTVLSKDDKKNSGLFPTVDKINRSNIGRQEKVSYLRHFSVLSFMIDLVIVLISIFLMNYLKWSDLVLSPRYIKFAILFVAFWLIISGYFKKFNFGSYSNFRKGIILIGKSSSSILYFIAITLVISDYYRFSPIQTLGTCAIYFFLELIVFTVYYWSIGKHHFKFPLNRQIIEETVNQFSAIRVILDFIALSTSFYLLNYLKRGTFDLHVDYEKISLIVYGVWFFSGLFTGKFENRKYKNVYYELSPVVKSFFLMFATMAIIVYVFHLYYFSRIQIFGSFILLTCVETIYIFSSHIYSFDKKKHGDINSVSETKKIFEQEKLSILQKANMPKKDVTVSIDSKLEHDYLVKDKKLYEFIKKHIDLNTIDQADARVLNTKNPYNIETLENQSISLILNLHKINDFRYINRYFLEVHKKIYNGGYFVGTAHTVATHREWFCEKFPRHIATILYPLDFVYRRIFPKLPGIKKVFFFITRGKDRILSKAEILGRLYFCGFKVLAVAEINNRLYYVAKCVENPSIDRNPSYGPIIRLKRIGYGSNVLYIRKFRTMHPYSEYLQDYIYEQNNLQPNGKFKSDFRLTDWGKWLRKFWIDELPQLINFIRGDLNLIGVRALSQHYFELYPQELQELRTQFKPGLIPPYYADMPDCFDEIIESEKRYLYRKLKNRFTTDVEYFFKALFNIIFKRARSL